MRVVLHTLERGFTTGVGVVYFISLLVGRSFAFNLLVGRGVVAAS